MMAEGMSERFIRQLAKEKVGCGVPLSKVHQCRLAAEQQAKGTPLNGSQKHSYDTAEETTTREARTTQKLKMEASKSQTILDKPTISAATYSQMGMVSKTGREGALSNPMEAEKTGSAMAKTQTHNFTIRISKSLGTCDRSQGLQDQGQNQGQDRGQA
uniref:Uncharacterized protein n=1 Tax=Romanomermis culicivorax TaxID=13658 RepID=A0A915I5H6_ROMCU